MWCANPCRDKELGPGYMCFLLNRRFYDRCSSISCGQIIRTSVHCCRLVTERVQVLFLSVQRSDWPKSQVAQAQRTYLSTCGDTYYSMRVFSVALLAQDEIGLVWSTLAEGNKQAKSNQRQVTRCIPQQSVWEPVWRCPPISLLYVVRYVHCSAPMHMHMVSPGLTARRLPCTCVCSWLASYLCVLYM